jgi:RNA polymerase sigma-70 factor (ECF subfamily)
MWERYGQFVKGSNVRAWAITIAHYRVLEYIRAKKKNNKIHFSETLVELIHDDMEKKTDYTKEYLSHLKDCIKKLSLKDKDMIILKYYRSLKAEELSLRFKKSVRTIYLNLSRIQRQLLKCIKRGMAVEKA